MSATSTRRLFGFDGLRAIAALTVLAYHVSLSAGYTRHGTFAPLFSELKAGVGVFFVISGTVLYLPYARAIRDGRPLQGWRRYARRRAVRILPAYWVALTVFAIGPFGSGVLTANWWRYYGLGQIYSEATYSRGLGPAWSLCVEVSFYAVLPLLAAWLALVAQRRGWLAPWRLQLSALASLVLLTALWRALAAGSLAGPVPGPYGELARSLPGLIDWFAVGMILAVLISEWEQGRRRARWLATLAERPGLCWTLGAGLFVGGAAAQQGDLYLPVYGLYTHLAIAGASALLVLPAAAPDASLRRSLVLGFLGSRTMTWLGTISYGIYLWHIPVLRALPGTSAVGSGEAGVPALLAMLAATIAGAVTLAALSWQFIERPAQRAFGQRRSEPAPAAESLAIQV